MSRMRIIETRILKYRIGLNFSVKLSRFKYKSVQIPPKSNLIKRIVINTDLHTESVRHVRRKWRVIV